MFGKVIVFGLFEMIKKKKVKEKKKSNPVPGSGFSLRVRSGTAVRAVTESKIITVGLFWTSSFKRDCFGRLPPGTSEPGVVFP